MSRELLSKIIQVYEKYHLDRYIHEDDEYLFDEIKETLKKPEPEPAMLVNVWTDYRDLKSFNIEWTVTPLSWFDGTYKLYINQSTPQHQTHSEQS